MTDQQSLSTTEANVEQGALVLEDGSSQAPDLDLLLVVFVHGGTDTTFHSFPERLRHILSQTVDNVTVECIVYPAYETKGELHKAVEAFADWLTTLTVEREVAHGSGRGAGKAKLVLCGHSMGGLLIADTLLEVANSRPDKDAPLWPRIIACLAFDTPYLGLHPFIFKNGATKVAQYANTAKTVATDIFDVVSSLRSKQTTATTLQKPPIAALPAPPGAAASSNNGWGKWMPAAYAIGSAVVAGAAAGTAYWRREDLNSSYSWATDHMRYVGTLWDEAALQRRLDAVIELEAKMGIVFRNYYTFLPSKSLEQTSRTFIVLPTQSASALHFLPAQNSIAEDEVQAHIGMFEASTNDGYYRLGLETAKALREAVMLAQQKYNDKETKRHGIEGAV